MLKEFELKRRGDQGPRRTARRIQRGCIAPLRSIRRCHATHSPPSTTTCSTTWPSPAEHRRPSRSMPTPRRTRRHVASSWNAITCPRQAVVSKRDHHDHNPCPSRDRGALEKAPSTGLLEPMRRSTMVCTLATHIQLPTAHDRGNQLVASASRGWRLHRKIGRLLT